MVYEIIDFIEIFRVNFAEEKRPKFKASYLSFYCEFKLISNTRLKSNTALIGCKIYYLLKVNWCGTKL